MPPALSVVIPTLGRPGLLGAVLDGLAAQRAPRGFEVVVAVDAADPDPGAVEAAMAGRPALEARTVTAAVPGASAARNAGWRAARAPLILFLGDDTVPLDHGLVAEHLRRHAAHPAEQVAVLGRVDWPRRVRADPFARWLEHGIQFDYRSIEGEEAGWGRLYAAHVSLKRVLLERVGGFDEELAFLYEDLDLALRLRGHGLRLLYAPGAGVEHRHPPTLEAWRARMALVAHAERRVVARHPDVAPYFHDLLAPAAAIPAGRGWGARLARVIPEAVPWLGPRIWARADLWYRQQLAPAFLAAWEAEEG